MMHAMCKAIDLLNLVRMQSLSTVVESIAFFISHVLSNLRKKITTFNCLNMTSFKQTVSFFMSRPSNCLTSRTNFELRDSLKDNYL